MEPARVGHNAGAMRRLVLALALAAAGCHSHTTAQDPAIERAARALRATRDPATASGVVRGLAGQDGCAGLGRALVALTRGQISGRVLSGLVDDAVSAAHDASCEGRRARAALGTGNDAAHQLARARLLEQHPAQALAQLAAGTGEPAVDLRRAEILSALDRPRQALAALDAAVAALPADAQARAARMDLLVALGRPAEAVKAAGGEEHPRDPALVTSLLAALVADGQMARAAALWAAAPLPDRSELARRAARAATSSAALERLGSAPAAGLELWAAVADRIEALRGAAAALPWRARAAAAAPDRAEPEDALARSLAAAGQLDQALAAWDRATTAAPAQPTYQLEPIRALMASGRTGRARARAARVIAAARRARRVDPLVTAAAAAAAAGQAALAVTLAREARAVRPGDGRLAFLLGQRLAEAGDRREAARVWHQLLVCGAHGRPWHRHEVAGRLMLLGDTPAAAAQVEAVIESTPPCTAVAPRELATYLSAARRGLAKNLAAAAAAAGGARAHAQPPAAQGGGTQ